MLEYCFLFIIFSVVCYFVSGHQSNKLELIYYKHHPILSEFVSKTRLE